MTEWMDPSERVLVKYPLFKTAVARIQACFDSFGAAGRTGLLSDRGRERRWEDNNHLLFR